MSNDLRYEKELFLERAALARGAKLTLSEQRGMHLLLNEQGEILLRLDGLVRDEAAVPETKAAPADGLIKRMEVEGSTSIASFGYDFQNHVLEVEFAAGGVYQYYDVPSSVYEDMVACNLPNAELSVGKYLQRNVKGSYRYAKVSG